MVRNVLFLFLFLVFPVFGASLLSSTRGVVSVFGNRLYEDDVPVRYACAAGVGLPYGISEKEALESACQELAERLVRTGFNMVRLPDLAVPGGDAVDDRGQGGAGAAPGGEKVQQNRLFRLQDLLLKIFLRNVQNRHGIPPVLVLVTDSRRSRRRSYIFYQGANNYAEYHRKDRRPF